MTSRRAAIGFFRGLAVLVAYLSLALPLFLGGIMLAFVGANWATDTTRDQLYEPASLTWLGLFLALTFILVWLGAFIAQFVVSLVAGVAKVGWLLEDIAPEPDRKGWFHRAFAGVHSLAMRLTGNESTSGR